MRDSQARILVVDDDPKVVGLVKEVLDLLPCETLVAVDGEGALDLLRREVERGTPVDTVLLDVMMPGEDGFRILERMKADSRLGQTPVILITGLDSIPAKTRGLQMGADDYILKPFDPQELLARVGVVLRIRRTEQMLRRRNQELAALDEVNRMISSSLNLDEVLVSALEGLGRLIETDALALVLNDEESQSWVVRTARAEQGVWLEGRVVPADDEVMHETLIGARSVLRRDVHTSFWNEALGMAQLDVLCVPLVKRDEVLGALVVLRQEPGLDEDYIPLLEHLAATVSVALQNARLFQDLESFAEEIERSQNQLIQAEKMAAVGRLAASLAHEINNPLQAIQNSLHLALHQGLNEEKRREFLEMAQQEVARLVQIVRRMLDFYRPSSTMQPLDVNRPVEDALAIAGKRLQQAQIEVVARLAPNLVPVRGAPNQLTQVFLNIIINAVDAMPNGGTLWVGTAYHAERKQVVVAFRDSGPGIAPEIREHMFEPFHTSKPTGTGLGLAISYGIIERHGGVIEVESPPGGGTTFIVRLPQHFEEA
ncbi:MAG TPA: response regulator [Anaerolineae bacterium]|nr:response regulator [Anaerolineae bacterium]HQK13359.1 response regulator [Anaerolineae bacterium]